MKHLFILITIIIFLSTAIYGQTITELFKALPPSYFPELTEAGKDSLILYGEYIPAGQDSKETIKYSFISDTVDHVQIEYSFTTSQSAFIIFELKRFETQNGGVIVVFSKYGGMLRSFQQDFLKVFEFRNNQLFESQALQLPSRIEFNEFIKPGTPIKLIEELKNNINTGYNLNPENAKTVEYTAFIEDIILNYELLYSSITYFWNGKNFIRK